MGARMMLLSFMMNDIKHTIWHEKKMAYLANGKGVKFIDCYSLSNGKTSKEITEAQVSEYEDKYLGGNNDR